MAHSHIGHDCFLEDSVILCNQSVLGGHCYVMHHAYLGLGTTVHQKQVIGSYVLTGMNTTVPKHTEIRPANIYAGSPARHLKENLVAIDRHELSGQQIHREEEQYSLLRSGWSGADAIKVEHTERELITILSDYTKTRSEKYKAKRWAIADAVVEKFGKVDYDTWRTMYDQTISLLWQQQENFIEDQKAIAEKFIKPARRLFRPEPLPGGDNVAWLVRNCSVGMYAPYKHVRAFIQGMVDNGMTPLVYIYGPYDHDQLQDLAKLGVEFKISNDPAEIRAWCELDKVGTLIADSYSSMVLTLYEMRTAPSQMYLSPGFQLFPCDTVLVPPTQIHLAQKTEAVHSPMLWEHLYQDAPALEKRDGITFGVLGRYEKISSEYLEMVTEILDAVDELRVVPDTQFHAYGRGDFHSDDPRIIAKGFANPHAALPTLDVYLDTWPLCGGVSVWEAMAHRVPVITRNSPDVESWNVFKPQVVNSKHEYIRAAIDAITNPKTDTGYRTVRNFTDTDAAGRRLIEVINGNNIVQRAKDGTGGLVSQD